MPRTLRVTVAALTFGAHSQLPDGPLKAALLAAGTDYDLLTRGHVYGDSPDDWAPYENGVPVIQYLRDIGSDINSLSSYLAKPDRLHELTRNTDLYLFDPIFLICPAHADLINRLDGAISATNERAACTLLPGRMPRALRDLCRQVVLDRLPLIASAFDAADRSVVLDIEMARDLKAAVRRFAREQGQGPRADSMALMQELLLRLGVQNPGLTAAPQLGSQMSGRG